MSETKARERKEERMAEEREADKKDRAGMVAIVAAILASRSNDSGIFANEAQWHVEEARKIIGAAYHAEDLPSPFAIDPIAAASERPGDPR